MKRIIAATLAAATALSLSTGIASGQGLDASSRTDRGIAREINQWHFENPGSWTAAKKPTSSVTAAQQSSETIKDNSSEETRDEVVESSWGIAKSSLEKDVQNNDPFGTNLNSILAIAGIIALGATLYGIALQAGSPLPHIAAQ